jgi:acyl-CoA thioesterase-1
MRGSRRRTDTWSLTLIAVAVAAAACRATPAPPSRAGAGSPTPAPSDGPLIVFLGDSLTAGLNLEEEQAYPALIEKELRAEGRSVRVLNAGVSGDTTAGGLRRLPWILRQKPAVVVVALGANDGLRGQDLRSTESNLRAIVAAVHQGGARVLLVGMRVPPNYGADYARRFAGLYPRLAQDLGVPLVPFLLDGVAGRVELNLPDGIHPTAQGHRLMAATVLPFLRPLIGAPAAPETAPGRRW